MTDKLTTYVRDLISMTCGFTPAITVKELSPESYQIIVSGTTDERALVMGREGKTIQAFTRLSQIFARRNKVFVYMYVKPRDLI